MPKPRSPWRYALGACVTWAGGDPDAQPYRVRQRRITESGVRAWIEYLLSSERYPGREASWGYEPDCVTWEGR